MKLDETFDAFIQFAEYYGWEYAAMSIYQRMGDFTMQDCIADLYTIHDMEYSGDE